MRIFLMSILSIFTLAGCQTAKQELVDSGKVPMNNAELESLYQPGLKLAFVTEAGIRAIFHVEQEDAIKITSAHNYVETGVKSIENDKICYQWHLVRSGRKSCFEMYDLGNGRYRSIDNNGNENVKNIRVIQ